VSPQPLGPKYRKKFGHLNPRPESIRHIGSGTIKAISSFLATWSWFDATRQRLVLSLMKADHRVGFEMLDVIQKWTTGATTSHTAFGSECGANRRRFSS
jgi:hypothetical protein